MDLKRFFRVIRRRKLLMLGGTALAAVVAFAAYTQLTKTSYESQSELLITQQTDPYGSATQSPTLTAGSGVTYLSALGPIYAAIANGDVVQGQLKKAAPDSQIVATDVVDPGSGADLPLVQLMVSDPTAAGARQVAGLAASALEKYIAQQQVEGGVPSGRRVQLAPVQNGAQTKLLAGPSKTTAAIAFIGVLFGTILLAFKLEKSASSGEGELTGIRLAPAGEATQTSGANQLGTGANHVGSARRVNSA